MGETSGKLNLLSRFPTSFSPFIKPPAGTVLLTEDGARCLEAYYYRLCQYRLSLLAKS